MKAVARLLLTCFTGSPAAKWLTISGLLLILASLYVVLCLPQTEHKLEFAMPGILAFFLASSLMPLTIGRLSQSHIAGILPGVRIKLLACATLTVLMVALPAGLLTPVAYVAGMSADVSQLFKDPRLREYTLWLAAYTYTSACIAAAWIYVLVWFVTSERNTKGFFRAMVVVLVLLWISRLNDQEPAERLRTNLQQLAVFFVVFSTGFLAWPRLKRWRAGRPRAAARNARAASRDVAGREIDLVLGNARPWVLIGVLLLPLLATLGAGGASTEFWLLYLAIAGIIAGGNSERAPARSRALWLRSDGSRAALFSAIERSAWRHNGLVMVALVLVLLGFGSFAGMPAMQMITGILLILVGTTLSTYLGLSLTRGVRVGESLLAIAVMMGLMIVAVMAANGRVDQRLVGGSLAVLAALAITLRWVARSRWARIDWSRCRGDLQRALRAE